MTARPIIAFLGPTLSAKAARALASVELEPPARQGDVWRALERDPIALVLIDGVFETQPSVWHREILQALSQGVAVFGASSMGALRAAELHRFGMTGVGEIFEGYRDGRLIDDADVALLHATSEHGFRPLTVPRVNVRPALEAARRRKLLSESEAARIQSAADACFYQERHWAELVGTAELPEARREKVTRWLETSAPDQKREDAIRCLRAVKAWLRAGAKPPGPLPETLPDSSVARRRRLVDGRSRSPRGELHPNGEVLQSLWERNDAAELLDRGLRRSLLAAWAKSLGWSPTGREVERALADWFTALGVEPDERPAFLAASGLDEAGAWGLATELALERRMLRYASRVVPDGPSELEALTAEARLSGVWAGEVRKRRRRK